MCDGDCERGNHLRIGNMAAEGKCSVALHLLKNICLLDFEAQNAYNSNVTNSNIEGRTMDHIILGLLLMCNRTIYQLRDRISKGIHLMYSSSMGSIQAAVKKLLNCGYINYEEMVDNGKYKKVYGITESGKQHFYEWINAPIEEQSPKNPELAKIYFMGFSDKKNRETNIQQHLLYLKEQYNVLETICESAKNIDVSEEQKDILNYQFASALYGKDIIKFNIDWFEQLLGKMRNGEI